MRLTVIIPAAGSSRRFNADPLLGGRSKLDEDLGGRTVLQRTVELFHTRPETESIIVAGPHDPAAMDAFRERHADTLSLLGATIVPGGATHRWETVRAALDAVPEGATHIAVHDAARPACPAELIDRVLDAASRFDAVIPVLEIDSTVKRLGDPVADDRADPLASILGEQEKPRLHAVAGTLDRAGLALAQTPQVFERSLLIRAYAQGDLSSTDDAGLVERLGERVVAVSGDPRNIKITRPGDIEMIRRIRNDRGPDQKPAHLRF
ncbi:MAG: 2-C-methyl-D-erythritol 4-phosphate cytidylyltransferase [Phycisphaerales bacterium]|nr:2-C-methyl-D-erythritol 4-phosphate cytidylyltransferase [Planctomycetota bacterium]MCH8508879.1 2-C-methyl-D-erythritol 4-phosphate cytidylyltransferase [Phycisphaerales bacterium]